MQVPNDEWVTVASAPANPLLVQNTEQIPLALKMAGTSPEYDEEDPEDDIGPGSYMLLYPGDSPVTLPATSQNYYCRAIGPRDGYLYVLEPPAL
jgi:hypothetical protein